MRDVDAVRLRELLGHLADSRRRLGEAIHLHHAPESSHAHPQLTALVHVADFMAYELDYGAPGAFPPATCSKGALNLLGLDPAGCRGFQPAIKDEIQQALEILTLIQ